MSDGGQTQRGGGRREEDEAEVEAAPATEADSSEAVEGVDDLLDEIDDVLEENAEEFVRSYVQKGGQ